MAEAGAEADPILCYRYASDEEDEQVVRLVDELAARAIDLIAFTSTAQVRRLREVARRSNRTLDLDAAMHQIVIAAIGPVTAQAVEEAGWPVGAMPQDSFHLKPMIVALGKRLSGGPSPRSSPVAFLQGARMRTELSVRIGSPHLRKCVRFNSRNCGRSTIGSASGGIWLMA